MNTLTLYQRAQHPGGDELWERYWRLWADALSEYPTTVEAWDNLENDIVAQLWRDVINDLDMGDLDDAIADASKIVRGQVVANARKHLKAGEIKAVIDAMLERALQRLR